MAKDDGRDHGVAMVVEGDGEGGGLGGRATGDVFWAPVYTFFTQKIPGVTAAVRGPEEDPDVIGIDIRLDELSRFLASLSIGRTGRAYIVDRTGALSGSSAGPRLADAQRARRIRNTKRYEHMQKLEHRPVRWRAAGGGIHDPTWLQATSDALASELDVVDVTSGVGAGVFGLRAAGLEPVLPVARTVSPRADAADRYDRLYPLYREVYAQLRSTMAALGALDEAYQ